MLHRLQQLSYGVRSQFIKLILDQEQAEPPYLDDGFDGELQDSGRDLSSITKLVGSYIGSYASSAAAWIKYPYFGISTGVATVMVFLVIFYILILGKSFDVL